MSVVRWSTVAIFTSSLFLNLEMYEISEYTYVPTWLVVLTAALLYNFSLQHIESSRRTVEPVKLKNYAKQLIDGAFILLCLGIDYYDFEGWLVWAWAFGAYLHMVAVFGCLGYSRSFGFKDILLAQLICLWAFLSRGYSLHGKLMLLGVSLALQVMNNFRRDEFEREELEEKRFLCYN
ncbi:phosphatidylinositol:ceramideinositolphosphotransferase [Striga asiatica]|uniref:Phosphatidylinositol:ceramideinositolphosphotran sferase n=1 Tax=Striga asiatica TaxID=4170 RepID=A0A5A7P1B1_STRAF|nr:phosphatidylinositol:ceramideinositolphosphotransferase [Striga asiatica]